MIIVSNSSCLIGLARIKRLKLLKELYERIYIPQEVYMDVVIKGKDKPGAKEVEEAKGVWIEVKEVNDKLAVQVLLSELDPGEAETIVLAKEINADLVIIDEEKGANTATISDSRVMGTVGVLILAKKVGKLDSLQATLDQLRKKKFRLSDEIYQRVIDEESRGVL